MARALRRGFKRHHRRYGYRCIQAELSDAGVVCAAARIRRLMAARGLRAIQPKHYVPKTSDGRADKPSPNLLAGQPLPEMPNRARAAKSVPWLSTATWRERPLIFLSP